MKILGLMKTTLLDYPGLVASTIFLGGCNMRCPFCHNMNLVLSNDTEEYSLEEIFSHLTKRKGIIEGVCITGGEPTLYPDLPNFIFKIKNLGYKVKLDTNGTNPEMISSLISKGLVDYIAMDIKSSIATYPVVCGIENINTDTICKSINIIKNSAIDYEFRTTIISEYHDFTVIKDIATLLAGSKKYYLQSFTDSEYVPNHTLSACNYDTLQEYKNYLQSYIDIVDIRGTDSEITD